MNFVNLQDESKDTSYYRQRSSILRQALDEIESTATFTGLSGDFLRDEINKTVQNAMARLNDLRLTFEKM